MSAKRQLKETIEKYRSKAPDFDNWIEQNAEEGFTFYNYPKGFWRKIKTSNMLERLNREIKRRTRVANLFPNEASCQRLVTALLQEQHQEWIIGKSYLNMKTWELKS